MQFPCIYGHLALAIAQPSAPRRKVSPFQLTPELTPESPWRLGHLAARALREACHRAARVTGIVCGAGAAMPIPKPDEKVDSANIPSKSFLLVGPSQPAAAIPTLFRPRRALLYARLISTLVTAIEPVRNEMRFQLYIALHAVGVATDPVNAFALAFLQGHLKVVVGFTLLWAQSQQWISWRQTQRYRRYQ